MEPLLSAHEEVIALQKEQIKLLTEIKEIQNQTIESQARAIAAMKKSLKNLGVRFRD